MSKNKPVTFSQNAYNVGDLPLLNEHQAAPMKPVRGVMLPGQRGPNHKSKKKKLGLKLSYLAFWAARPGEKPKVFSWKHWYARERDREQAKKKFDKEHDFLGNKSFISVEKIER